MYILDERKKISLYTKKDIERKSKKVDFFENFVKKTLTFASIFENHCGGRFIFLNYQIEYSLFPVCIFVCESLEDAPSLLERVANLSARQSCRQRVVAEQSDFYKTFI